MFFKGPGPPILIHFPFIFLDSAPELTFSRCLSILGSQGVHFEAHVLCVNGLFFVSKKDRRLRMILDARPANDLFRSPPCSEYSSGSSFASLRVPRGEKLYGAQYDVRDFFYRLRVPIPLSKYFGLPTVRRDKLELRYGADRFKHMPSHITLLHRCFQVQPSESDVGCGNSSSWRNRIQKMNLCVRPILLRM